MISKKSYEREWIASISNKLGKRGDPIILEKVIYAFTLLEQLKLAGLDFIFKGGTSLLLLSSPPRRFSIDIDIITQAEPQHLTAILDKVIAMAAFTRWVDDSNRKHTIDAPIGHYKLYYKSKTNTMSGEEPILLDVLYADNPYPGLMEVPVIHEWLDSDGDTLTVYMPAIESIAGDKLTAFAPNTTGILYQKGRPVEIIKQLYDLAFLFDNTSDFRLLREAYIRVAEEEIKYRKLTINWQAVLTDTFETCIILAARDIKDENFVHLQRGITNIVNFVLENFRIEEAIICAAKVAYTTRIIINEGTTAERFTDPSQIAALTIDTPEHRKLNRLKKTNPEAFFYWYYALK